MVSKVFALSRFCPAFFIKDYAQNYQFEFVLLTSHYPQVDQNCAPAADQSAFMECYRGRQTWIHHAAYMRMSKVLFALQLCREAGVSLENKDIFDYGFGAGTFFRYCPTTSRLFGVELDPENVNAVRGMLRRRGFTNMDLRAIEIDRWQTHPLLERKYDIILCSHVLEHLPDPITFLRTMANCLRPSGVFLGIVPINERWMDPHHVQVVDRKKVAEWAGATGLLVESYTETDPWMYRLQPIIAPQGKYNRLMAQVLSISIGIPATLLKAKRWFRLSKHYARLTASLPMQAGFLLRL